MNYSPEFSAPIFTDTLKMYYVLTVATCQIFSRQYLLPVWFIKIFLPNISHVRYKDADNNNDIVITGGAGC